MAGQHAGLSMAEDRRGRFRPGNAEPAPSPRGRPFDAWLNRQLHAMYGELAQEPLPAGIVNLIEQDSATATHAAQPDAPTAGTDEAGNTPADPTPRDKDDG